MVTVFTDQYVKNKKGLLNQIKSNISEYFTFTKSERNGITILVGILIILMGFLYYTHFITPPQNKLDIASLKNEVAQFEASLTPREELGKPIADSTIFISNTATEVPKQLLAFNPNHLPEEKWKSLGVPDWLIERIKNYESKGGHFRKKEDLSKIYSMPPDLFQRLAPYIEIAAADTSSRKVYDTNSFAKERAEALSKLMVDINIANETELDALPMIGLGRAKKIIEYRNNLHGFTHKEQLLEVWSINDTIYNAIANYIEVGVNTIRPININTKDPAQLRHPYINFSLAKMIANYHSTHGDYKNIEEIKKLPLVSGDLYAKLAPYLTVH